MKTTVPEDGRKGYTFTHMTIEVLLIRPDPGNERFGLGPFFRVEPLGMEYIGAALLAAGHRVTVLDLRYDRLTAFASQVRPALVGIACMHALEYDQVLQTARAVRRLFPQAFVVVGGHAAAAYPEPLCRSEVDALCLDDGEEVLPALAQAIAQGTSKKAVPALLLQTIRGFERTAPLETRTSLNRVPLPARHLVSRYRNHYLCLNFRPVWLIETARGCPFRCSFCSVWQLYDRSFRERSLSAVVEDFARTGPHVFVADDLFFNHPARSRELARALKRKGIHKRWLLVQTRTDLVARHPELLEEWREVAELFDIFFGLESATDEGLSDLSKDNTTTMTVRAAQIARSLNYGVTGNFVIDPGWNEEQFEKLWDFVARHGLSRAGYTLLTPLPGTALFAEMKEVLEGQPWFKYDMHHLLWEPRLGAQRFFELYAETWRRSVLNLSGQKKWSDWMRKVNPLQIPALLQVLWRTQRLMQPDAYLKEHDIGVRARPIQTYVRHKQTG